MTIAVKVSPNAKKPGVEKLDEKTFRVRVDARPVEGEANKRLVEILADYFGVTKSSIRIVRGFTGRNKVVEVGVRGD